MRKLRWILVSGLLICGCFFVQLAAPLWGQQETNAPKTGAAADRERELDIRYAEAYLKLMEATLARHEESNRTMPNTVRPTVIQGIQSAVREARERVELARRDEAGDSEIYVSSAEAELRLAEEALRRSQAANAKGARAISDGEVARLRAQVDLAKVRVEKARHLASESPLSNVRYELELLREDVQELQIFVALLRRN